jgi:hypothetical protein
MEEIKNRHTIVEELDVINNSDSDDTFEEYPRDIHVDNIEIIDNIRLRMIEYCDNMSLPLCDYLTHDAICNFIDFISLENKLV